MSEEELDQWAQDLAKRIDACDIYDYDTMRAQLNESEKLRLEFVKLYKLDVEDE